MDKNLSRNTTFTFILSSKTAVTLKMNSTKLTVQLRQSNTQLYIDIQKWKRKWNKTQVKF